MIGRVSYVFGFLSALVGYSFHTYLWDYAFYHLVAFAFVLYLLEGYLLEKNKRWRIARFGVLITAINSFVDEIRGVGGVFDWSEYIAFVIIIIYTIYTINKTVAE